MYINFWVTAGIFDMKFHAFITWSYLHKTAKQHLIIFNHGTVIDFLSDRVQRMFAERETQHICTGTQKTSSFEQHNKHSSILEVSTASFQACI